MTALGSCRTFVVAKFDCGGGDTKVTTINIRSVNLHTPESLRPATDGDGGYRDATNTTTTTGHTTIKDPVYVQVFEVSAPGYMNYEAFRVVVSQPTSKTPGWTLSPLAEDAGSVVGDVLSHLMNAYT